MIAFTPATDGPAETPIEPDSRSGESATSNPMLWRKMPEPIGLFRLPMLPLRKSKPPFLMPKPAPTSRLLAVRSTSVAPPAQVPPCCHFS